MGLPIYFILGSVSTLCFNFAYKSASRHGSCHSPRSTNMLCHPSCPSEGPGCPSRGQVQHDVAMGPGQTAIRALCRGCFPFAQELHSSFSPWPWPFLELGCSCDPTDPAALCWFYPRPAFSPWTCPSVTELVAEPGFCHQTSLQCCGTVPLVHDSAPSCLAVNLGSQVAFPCRADCSFCSLTTAA